MRRPLVSGTGCEEEGKDDFIERRTRASVGVCFGRVAVRRVPNPTDPLAWPALIVPEDRNETFGYIERVKAGEAVVHEFRIQRPSDLQFRWIRSVGFHLGESVAIKSLTTSAIAVAAAKSNLLIDMKTPTPREGANAIS